MCENMILTIQGAAYYRGGMKYAHATKNNTGVLLRDFSYNDNDCYTMELGDHYMRFYRDQKLMVDANNQPLELVTPYAAADLFDEDGKPAISKAQSADLIYLFQNGGKYPVQRLERNANGSFTLQAVDYAEDGGFEDINMDKTKRVYVSAQTGDNITITATHSIFKSGHVGDISTLSRSILMVFILGRRVKVLRPVKELYRTIKHIQQRRPALPAILRQNIKRELQPTARCVGFMRIAAMELPRF